jgi:hypothetical protein
MSKLSLCLSFLLAALATPSDARDVNVSNDPSLRRALADAKPGNRILIAPGRYQPGLYARNLQGTAEQPIIIEAADPKKKPLIEGGSLGLQLSDPAHLVLRNLIIRGQSGNGINIDDAGSFDTPAHHITLEGLEVLDIGPRGNRDPIKLSGIDDLTIRNCRVEGWAGQGIDMVGCHRVLIESCTFKGKAGFDQGIAIQAKGGSSQVLIRKCDFLNAGQRGVNLGGSTDLRVFRPQGAKYEAKDITVEGCRFIGGMAPIAFVGVDGAIVRYNTIYRPEAWVLRILQETREPGFVPSRAGRFERNLIIFSSRQLRTIVNIGAHTAPDTFSFRENFWYCDDRPERSRPDLPTREQNGVYGTDPRLKQLPGGTIGPPAAGPAQAYGADALATKGGRDEGR